MQWITWLQTSRQVHHWQVLDLNYADKTNFLKHYYQQWNRDNVINNQKPTNYLRLGHWQSWDILMLMFIVNLTWYKLLRAYFDIIHPSSKVKGANTRWTVNRFTGTHRAWIAVNSCKLIPVNWFTGGFTGMVVHSVQEFQNLWTAWTGLRFSIHNSVFLWTSLQFHC